MARRLRLQYPGALYHVINRGNYRHAVFETEGAAKAFEAVLGEACERFGWVLHAYAIMRNHFHLALETPQPNLIDGMHWLQSTYATRFNRFRSEHGHLFQGRYKSLVVQDAAALVRLINYIHLNPVRAGTVKADQVAAFRWSSLSRFIKGTRPPGLTATDLLAQLGLSDTAEGWDRYVRYLVELSNDAAEQQQQDFSQLSRGWAIGTQGWRKALAQEHTRLALMAGIAGDELRDIKEAVWRRALDAALQTWAKTQTDVVREPQKARWKIEIAAHLRRQSAAPYRWIAAALNMGNHESLRVYVCHQRN
jgi:REP element-mobilizing transposase RayT